MPKLLALYGPRRGIVRDLEGSLVVGRSGDTGLQLLDEKVSREHCAFESTGPAATVRDLGSRNGTWVNGQRIEGVVTLKAGDEIGIGNTMFLFDPPFDVLVARDGEATLLLTDTAATAAKSAPPPTLPSLEKAGELALRAAMAPTPNAAARLLAQAASESLRAESVLVLVRTSGGAMRPLLSWPDQAQVSVGKPLLELAEREGRAFAMSEPQATAESDKHVTKLRRKDAQILCAPFHAAGEAAGAICVTRSEPFDANELALAGALAAAAGPALVRGGTIHDTPGFELPVAESPSMQEAMELATAASKVPSTVLVVGESGTGKEEIARAIHTLGSRARSPFVAVNCGAIPSELAESELFGHEKGAFTGALTARTGVFEQADGGTLFLDEIGDLPLALQVKLLRALQDRVVQRIGGRTAIPVDVRVIVATHRDLQAMVKAGTFREDLFWRLNVLSIKLAPLRDRREDIAPLTERLLRRIATALGRTSQGLTNEATTALSSYEWPGNVRQLSNALERALVLKREPGPIELGDLPPEVLSPAPRAARSASGRKLDDLVRELEKEQVTLALRRAKGVKVAAAEALGISRPTLDRKIEEYAIDLFEPAPA